MENIVNTIQFIAFWRLQYQKYNKITKLSIHLIIWSIMNMKHRIKRWLVQEQNDFIFLTNYMVKLFPWQAAYFLSVYAGPFH